MAKPLLRKLMLLALLCQLGFSVSAMTISVVPAEGKEYAPPPDGSGSPLGFLTSGCMDALFGSGWIVTDSMAFRGPRASWSPADYSLRDAREGRVDFLIALYVDWTQSAFYKDALLPTAVAYKLVRVADGKIIIEGEVKGAPDSEDASNHVAEVASRLGARVAESCMTPLRALSMGGEL